MKKPPKELKIKAFRDDPTLDWEERFEALNEHHIDETSKLITEVDRLRAIVDRQTVPVMDEGAVYRSGWRQGIMDVVRQWDESDTGPPGRILSLLEGEPADPVTGTLWPLPNVSPPHATMSRLELVNELDRYARNYNSLERSRDTCKREYYALEKAATELLKWTDGACLDCDFCPQKGRMEHEDTCAMGPVVAALKKALGPDDDGD